MQLDALLNRLTTTTPLWLLGALLVGGCVAACEFGFQVYERTKANERLRKRRDDRDSSGEGLIITAALGLLALLIGFSFTVTLQRFQTRDALVVQEANAIGMTWRRARAIGGDGGAALAAQVAAYLDARIAQFAAGSDGLHHGPAALPAEARREQLWPLTEDAIAPIRDTPLAVAMLAATETTLDISAERDGVFEQHLPPRVMLLLLGNTMITAFILGYVLAATDNRHRIATTTLFVLITAAIVLLIDLDRPFGGSVELDSTPLTQLQTEIRRLSGG